jgi:cellulose synthase/poly-beta-1,6-N-acetylglucosamine synthase-like glycosyltransferase
MAEYRGFFHIGMVTRNERNAIIQHGTMTMIRRRRSTRSAAGPSGASPRTRSSAAALREGHKALYIPCTYGRGLMPDTFADFKKQRFRWAYGAVRSSPHHRRSSSGSAHRLSAGQRYHFVAGWLPWFADGFNLLFNFAALAWSVAMVMFPSRSCRPT